ncbi:MAG TPA: tRNA epoxyqueuosine(34) reductase QueG [Cycloclasticus sp.]|jgi:epoxyqueuosine reductase|nr:tRNA epoxyqueuosine(34) reductase QueG [Cycloclasticus sp.]HIL91481.1 tRNA epoxyqueuosine(34) reductase QueG [Cycloclasticus sp.]
MSENNIDFQQLANDIKALGLSLGFQQVGITDTQLSDAEKQLNNWLDAGLHGEMHYMQKHGSKRTRPAELHEGTVRVISCRMDYLPEPMQRTDELMDDPVRAYISRYALGRDYHKVIRKKLQKLADLIEQKSGVFGYRAFVDSAPVMEKALAEKAGLGWIGKHSNVLNKEAGSWFFLGELYVDLPLPIDTPAEEHCGRCTDCIDICPTQAIIAPYTVDARRCISYLTIELHGSIPEEFRPLMENRIYGCDDCQQVCPWNRFASLTDEGDFMPRNNLDSIDLIDIFEWSEDTFLKRTEGSAIRRIGYESWVRNIAVALGNAPKSDAILDALFKKKSHANPIIREHVRWAIQQQNNQI